jgi:hypothetical protein
MKKLLCLFKKHDLVPIVRYTRICVKLECKRCQRQFAYNSDIGLILDWSPDIADFYERELPDWLERMGCRDEYNRIELKH